MEKEINNLPSFSLNEVPSIRIKSIHFLNYKTFKNYEFDFTNESGIMDFICFIGPNGGGKSTVLNAIQLLFTRFEGRDLLRLPQNLGKLVRHVGKSMDGVYGDDDFLLTAQIQSSVGDYEVQMNKRGFIKDHPPEIKEIVYRLCYFSKFDRDLDKFQLERGKWGKFKELFEAVTGFKIEENSDIETYLSGTSDPSMQSLIRDYVLAFYVYKPNGIIHQKECSDGEKKIIKSFSTLLTIEYMPEIILVDNIEMHVERSRHISLIEAMKKCFPNSQIFSTTHSYYISKYFGKKSGIFDLRIIESNDFIKKEPWRLCIIDELNDSMVKIMVAKDLPEYSTLQERGKNLLDACYCNINDLHEFRNNLKIFLKDVADIFSNCVLSLS